MLWIKYSEIPNYCVPIVGQTPVMGICQLFAVKIMKFGITAMMIIIWESRNILAEKSIMKKTVCCQEAGERISLNYKKCQ